MTTDRHACGLSSFLPMSCRGRAEAFARRLQSRLQSLGRQPSDDHHDSEESWLTTSQQAFPTSRQPRLSSSSESDIYFDFDCDFGSPESPQEEATEAIVLNRRRECGCILEGQDAESGCVTASASATATMTSPGSSESSDTNYYDTEMPLNDDLSALIDSTLQQACTHVQCNGYEPACLDCGTGTSCCPQLEDAADVTLNGHLESHSNESKLSPSPCGSESETTPTNETRNDAFNTFVSPLGVDDVDNAGLRRYCRRARKPRVDYTKCNGLRHDRSRGTTETHEGDTKAHEAEAATHEAEAATHEANETKAKAHEEGTDAHEVHLKTPESETETIESEAASHETEEKTHGVEAVRHGVEAETNEAETKTHEVVVDTHEVEAKKYEAETKAHEEVADTHEVEVGKCEVETKAHELVADTHEFEVGKCELETKAYEVVAETHEDEAGKYEVETDTLEAKAEVHEGKTETNEEVENSMESPLSPTGPVYMSSMTIHGGAEECCDNTFLTSLNILKKELLIECPAMAKTTVPGVEITEAPPSTAEAAPHKATKEGASKTLEVDDDIEDDRPQRVRRCSSLKTGKTPPGTPGRKKIVRFADVLGLDLADVRTFLDEVPKVPNSAYEDLQDADLSLGSSSSIHAVAASMGCSMPKPDKILVALFVQPGGCPDFLDRVREQLVCLENAVVNDAMLGTIAGTVRVRNLDFHKSVHVRYTVDDWKSFSDLQASYVQNSCDGFSDTFSFTLYAHTVTIGQRLELAVRFQCHGCQYWDSNRGSNYAFQCLPPAGQSPFRAHLMSTLPDEQWASFY